MTQAIVFPATLFVLCVVAYLYGPLEHRRSVFYVGLGFGLAIVVNAWFHTMSTDQRNIAYPTAIVVIGLVLLVYALVWHARLAMRRKTLVRLIKSLDDPQDAKPS